MKCETYTSVPEADGETGSLRTTDFHYVECCEETIQSMSDRVERAESIVILGNRGIGKQFVLSRIRKAIASDERVLLRLNCDEFVHSLKHLVDGTWDPWLEALTTESNDTGIGPFAWKAAIKQFLGGSTTKNVVLFASNIDALPSGFAREFLQHLRELTQLPQDSPSRFSVVLSGAYDLKPLVYGENSEFHISDQYILQGFSLPMMRGSFKSIAEVSGVGVVEECMTRLYNVSRGNQLFVRIILETVLERRRRNPSDTLGDLTDDELQQAMKSIGTHSMVYSDGMLRNFFRIEESPSSLEQLCDLLLTGRCEIVADESKLDRAPPSDLELSGIARREKDGDVSCLKWATWLVEQLCRDHFTTWNLASTIFACESP